MDRTKRTFDMALLGVLAVLVALSLVTGSWAQDRSAGRVLDDAKISLSVKGKLVADRPKNLTKVDVKVLNGIVTLGGEVETAEQKAQAEALARRTDGVKEVVNNIQVSPQPAAQPR